MKGKTKAGGGGAPADLLVCFPSRAHLALLPRPICSPCRTAHLPKRLSSRPTTNRAQASPFFRSNLTVCSGAAATVATAGISDDEPTSPKVTCAGQIKVGPSSRHHSKPSALERKKTQLPEALGFKKEIMQFLGALSSLRVAMRCFGSFNGTEDYSTDVDEDEEEEEELEGSGSKTLLSNWFMLLEESQSHGSNSGSKLGEEVEDECSSTAPPPNALLLMRCRSAPAKREEEVANLVEEELNSKMIEDRKGLLLMNYAQDFSKFSTEIVKETWVVGNFDPLCRSRSWKR
ncbi:hypothetical protein AXF42_Ash002058 [Apostasia shenzhenica]|uniref:Uncharacterized protein n=1 Tax=Apostasia shenzhenica TaxID=1088818 RepID=A0A2I0AMQ1_9ASPA|nr:hypothetical protein AXF42_Ash002058 [Apostasia shenzhenica]